MSKALPQKAKPFIKYAGGKSKLASLIISHMPASFDNYYENFCGGGAVFFALATEPTRRYKRAVLSDINPQLMNTYQMVRDQPLALIACLKSLSPYTGDAAFYNKYRRQEIFNDPLQEAARVIYLNKSCFNGMLRVNSKGESNVPHGGVARAGKLNQTLYETIKACSVVLQGVELRTGSFEDTTRDIRVGQSCVMCDPPYIPLSKTASFTAFAGEFGDTDQAKLAQWCRINRSQGVFIIASNHDCLYARSLYEGFDLHEVQVQRNISAKASSRVQVGELIIVGKP